MASWLDRQARGERGRSERCAQVQWRLEQEAQELPFQARLAQEGEAQLGLVEAQRLRRGASDECLLPALPARAVAPAASERAWTPEGRQSAGPLWRAPARLFGVLSDLGLLAPGLGNTGRGQLRPIAPSKLRR